MTVILQPVTLAEHNIYAPSRIRKNKIISYQEFIKKFADRVNSITVLIDNKLQVVTAYNVGLDCWYIVL